MSAIETAALELVTLLRWGVCPSSEPLARRDEWPYKIIASGEEDTLKLCASLTKLETTLKAAGKL